MDRLPALVDVVIGLITLGGIVVGWWRWGWPHIADRAAQQRDIHEVLCGRPAIPENPIKGEPAQPAKPSIMQMMATHSDALTEALAKLNAIDHELHPNGGGSMRDDLNRLRSQVGAISERLESGDLRFHANDEQVSQLTAAILDIRARLDDVESALSGELHTAHDTLHTSAEAARQAMETIQSAIQADPPTDA